MIYFLSDLHGDINFCGLNDYLKIAKSDDLLIILGDIGLKFQDSQDNRIFTQYFLSLEKNIAFIDGNHENFDYLKSFPEKTWCGGLVHMLSPNIVHLKRGNVFTIEKKNFFVFGGCKSSEKWKQSGLWHYGEEPESDELELAYKNLEKHNFALDYILTHKYERNPKPEVLCKELQDLSRFIDKNVKFKKWYYGHGHANRILDKKHIMVYNNLVSLENDCTD